LVAGVIGDPVRHSLSPVLHNAAFAALGLDWVFVALPVPAGAVRAALDGVRALRIAGLSVTMPHKEPVARAVDRRSPVVERLGAANTVVRRGDELVGESTDGEGFLAALRTECGFEPEGRRCLVVGAGGAARAVVLALAGAGAREVVVVNRTPARAREAASLAGPVGRVGGGEEAASCDLVVNATPLGMTSVGGGLEDHLVPAERLGAGQLVVDLVYDPPLTPLLAEAAARGARVANGLGMLVHQAALAFGLWTGEEAPLVAMREAVALAGGQRQ
jgi:shikimate dehydrogenase